VYARLNRCGGEERRERRLSATRRNGERERKEERERERECMIDLDVVQDVWGVGGEILLCVPIQNLHQNGRDEFLHAGFQMVPALGVDVFGHSHTR
jgi:hypothetical protein